MTHIELKLWEFGKAPTNLRDLFSDKVAGDWLVLVPHDQASDFVIDLIRLWSTTGLLVAQGRSANGDVVLAALHAQPAQTS
jgi:hypothetical protein